MIARTYGSKDFIDVSYHPLREALREGRRIRLRPPGRILYTPIFIYGEPCIRNKSNTFSFEILCSGNVNSVVLHT